MRFLCKIGLHSYMQAPFLYGGKKMCRYCPKEKETWLS